MARNLLLGGFMCVYKADAGRLSYGGLTGVLITDASTDRLWGLKRLVNVPVKYLHKPAIWTDAQFICEYTRNSSRATPFCCLFSKLYNGELVSVYDTYTNDLILQLFRNN